MKKRSKCKRIRGEKIYYSDVDETLVIIDEIPPGIDESKLIKIQNNKKGVTIYAMRHERHINLLKQMAARGFAIVVWSAGGEAWAWYIVNLLELEYIVDATMGKPDWYADDKGPNEFMKGRVYLHHGNPTKDLRGFVADALDAGIDPDDITDVNKNLPQTKTPR